VEGGLMFMLVYIRLPEVWHLASLYNPHEANTGSDSPKLDLLDNQFWFNTTGLQCGGKVFEFKIIRVRI
jgi:hypothetical protein